MMSQFPREAGLWEREGQVQSENSGFYHYNSNITWKVGYHLSIAVLLHNVYVNTASIKQSPGVQRKVPMALLYCSLAQHYFLCLW